jgi:hypothetical protein
LIFLEFDWANKHQTIMHDACKMITHTTDTGTVCMKARVCLCSGDGKLLKRFAGLWSLCFKGPVMRSCGKDVLDGAYLVCRLSVTSLVGGDLAADVSDDVMGDREVQHFYFHIAHISWSPFMVVFHSLKYVESTGTRITLEVPCARTSCDRCTRECFPPCIRISGHLQSAAHSMLVYRRAWLMELLHMSSGLHSSTCGWSCRFPRSSSQVGPRVS